MSKLFDRLCLIGIGLIGSSLARAVREQGLVGSVVTASRSQATCDRALELGIVDEASPDVAAMVKGADLVMICAPLGAYGEVAKAMGPHLMDGCIVSDVGSTKQAVIRDVSPHLRDGIHFVPGHPVAGTEHSGPDAGFAQLFEGRWCILTPPLGTDPAAVDKVAELWRRVGSQVEMMDPQHHDQVLAITSHLPHLIAYTIVHTATELEDALQQEVIKYSAGGFRDFTRIAASDPVMWRDIFLANKESVLEMLQRFSEDLTALQRAIRWGEGDKLQELFTRTRAVRRGIIDARQA